MKKIYLLTLIYFQLLSASNIEKAGDILQILVPAMGYGTALYLKDDEGQNQFYKSMATNLAVTYALKYTINKKRPNGAKHSFPSGHSSSAFLGASFIHKRYGIAYGIPAYLTAIFVAYSRVEAKAHYTSDVIAGAVIGIASSWAFTSRYKAYSIEVKNMHSGYGIEVKKHF